MHRTSSIVRSTMLAAALMMVAGTSYAMDDEGFRPLFNGVDLTGWEGDLQFWSVRDGAIVGQTTADKPTPKNTFLIWRDGELDDFELRFTYRIVGHNSGVQYRSRDMGDFVVSGYQADFEAGDKYSGMIYSEKTGRGILCDRGQKVTIYDNGEKQVEQVNDSAKLQSGIKKEDWNDYTVIARSNHIIHQVNGQTTAELIDGDASKASLAGILALQLHAGPPMTVEFKNIRLKRLPLENRKKIVLVAGTPSHAPGDHEFNAGSIVLKTCLDQMPGVLAALYRNGWPRDLSAFDNADSIVLYMDGGAKHPLVQFDRLKQIGALMDRGVGLACLHYAVEVPADNGGPELLKWIGGYYETGYSANPHWVGEFKQLPNHAIARGVQPYAIRDEWYFNIRFRPEMTGIIPILKATPPDEVRKTEASREFPGREEIVAWCVERPDGGRGFGFTGGHTHMNWGDDYFRKLVLNAIVWTAKIDVPDAGVPSQVTEEQLLANWDPKPARKPAVPKKDPPAK